MKKILLLVLLGALVLVGARCQKGSSALLEEWPEICKQRKDLPGGFPKDLIYPDAVANYGETVGMEGVTGGQVLTQDGFSSTFCVKAEPDAVESWYIDKFTSEGYQQVFMEGETDLMFMKGKESGNVWVDPDQLEGGITYFSLQTMKANY